MVRNPECTICDTISDPANGDVTLFDDTTESTGWRAVLMKDQGALGASYLTTREHRSDIDELSDTEWQELRDLVRLMTAAMKREFHPVHMNLACDMNDAAAAGEPTHVHFKLRPRGFRQTSIGRETFSDPGFGTKEVVPHKVGRATLTLIRELLESGNL